MSQRITLLFSALTAVACFVAVGLVWNVMNKSQAINLAILEQLKTAPSFNSWKNHENTNFDLEKTSDVYATGGFVAGRTNGYRSASLTRQSMGLNEIVLIA